MNKEKTILILVTVEGKTTNLKLSLQAKCHLGGIQPTLLTLRGGESTMAANLNRFDISGKSWWKPYGCFI